MTRLSSMTLAWGLLLLALVTAIWTTELAHGDHGALDVEITDVVVEDDGGLLAIITVLDHGRPVPDLDSNAFEVTEDGNTVDVRSVESSEAANVPLSVVITLDTSGSMEGEAMSASQTAASEFVANLAGTDPAAVVSFADAAVVNQPFTTDRERLTDAIQALQAVGNTALYDAVARSAELAVTASTARRAVLLLSDGEDFGELSTVTREESLTIAQDSGSVFYAVGVGSAIDAAFLQELADRTGGLYISAPQAGDLADIYRSLSERLRGQYVLSLEPPDDAPGRHSINVHVETGDAAGSGTATYNRIAPVVPTPTSTVQAVPTETALPPTPTAVVAAPTSAEQSGSSDGGATLYLAGGGFLVLAGLGVVLYARRKRAGREIEAKEAPIESSEPAPAKAFSVPEPRRSGAELRIENGTQEVQTFPLSETPMTVGSAPGSDLVLTGGAEVAPSHLRLWWRDGRLMLHHLDRSRITSVNGQPAEWLALDPGDEIAIGQYRLTYADESQSLAHDVSITAVPESADLPGF